MLKIGVFVKLFLGVAVRGDIRDGPILTPKKGKKSPRAGLVGLMEEAAARGLNQRSDAPERRGLLQENHLLRGYKITGRNPVEIHTAAQA
jgi:hypothetical protein